MIHSFLLVQFMAWQSFSTTSLQVLFGLFLRLEPTSYSIHFSSQSLSSFHNTCPHHHNLFYCRTKIMSSIRNLFLSLSVLDKGPLNGCVCVCVYVYVCVWVVVYVVVVRRGRRRGQARDWQTVSVHVRVCCSCQTWEEAWPGTRLTDCFSTRESVVVVRRVRRRGQARDWQTVSVLVSVL